MTDLIIPQNALYNVATFKLLSDGKEITNTYTVLSLTVNRIVNRVPTARIVLRDGAVDAETFAASEGPDLIPGKELEIALGYDGNNKTVFKGLIVKHSLKIGANGDSILVLECKDKVTKLTIGRHSRYFTEVKDSEAIAQIIGSYSGISQNIEATEIQYPEIVQHYATDWDFILSRAEINGQIVLAENGKLTIKAPTTSGSPLVTLTYGVNILEFEAEMDARSQYAAVKAKAWSYKDQNLLEIAGTEPTVNKQGNLSGKNLAQVIALEAWELSHSGRVQEPELKAWADAQLLKSRLAKIQGRVKVKGYPDAKPDTLIELEGMGRRFNGLAYVSGIRHELNGGAWYTDIQLGLSLQWFYQETDIVDQPASGLLPGVNGLQIGVVVKLQDDPNNEDRILVKVPTIDNKNEGIWSRIATLYAGHNRGSFFRPEIGDEVIVGFLNDDPRDAIVLGMLNSSKNPAPLKGSDENHRKGFFTRSQMKVTFDDEKKIVSLETPGGNKIIISDEDKGIALKDQNGNTLTMNDRGIVMKSSKDITIEATGKLTLKATQDASVQGLNVNVKANAQFKAEGSAGAEVSTSAIAILKGSLVQIN
ncbi:MULTISPECIES: type VI secretion system tip protein VgrG [Calothrix]|uniref:Type VI secretion system tip protein VgrG n=2 Tax=Calothrix TaxID=1186 RepID=A0ABR8AI18_9CYAN|nr:MULTISPECIES: type VI secretion system tip protein VgrG [Calothrix]MBD2199389.1 type VI secretion system tip protein VgrG [Calothrix parietina FACHB-288]MBD2228071.1 type VI secretion system tip protein VgrG [Calothrix anomala FACHB-343]